MMTGTNGWTEWSKHVLAELKRLSDASEKHSEMLSEINTKVEAGTAGQAQKCAAHIADTKELKHRLEKVENRVWEIGIKVGSVAGAVGILIMLIGNYFL